VFLTSIYLGIAMEYAPGGDMFEYVVRKNGLREDEARWFFQQLIVGLDYCHKMVRKDRFLIAAVNRHQHYTRCRWSKRRGQAGARHVCRCCCRCYIGQRETHCGNKYATAGLKGSSPNQRENKPQ
jgi:hypothetical protein